MSLLPESEVAFAEVAASESYTFGAHTGPEVLAGAQGRDVGEMTFDATLHDPADINPLSLWQQITGEPQVDMVIPDRPLHFNVVAHQRRSTEADYFDIHRSKRELAGTVVSALEQSLPGMTDKVWSYEVGEAATQDAPDHVEVITTNGDPAVDAAQVADLCQDGLAIVISDFLSLPIESTPKATFPYTVAIKANHPLDLSLPANCGRVPSGVMGGEVNTDDPRVLKEVNRAMEKAHNDTITRLEEVGIAVGQIILNRRVHPVFGFDIDAADLEIATAIRSLISDKR